MNAEKAASTPSLMIRIEATGETITELSKALDGLEETPVDSLRSRVDL